MIAAQIAMQMRLHAAHPQRRPAADRPPIRRADLTLSQKREATRLAARGVPATQIALTLDAPLASVRRYLRERGGA